MVCHMQGGVFVIDVLALPIQTKVVKIWTLDFSNASVLIPSYTHSLADNETVSVFLLERSKTQAVLSFVTDLAKEGKVRNLGYPIPVVGQSTATAGQQANVLPIGVEMYIPTFIIHWNPSPEIGWWDAVLSSHRPHVCMSIMHVV